MMTQSRKLLALTMGDPSGIGPEISIKAWHKLHNQKDYSFLYVGCPDIIEKTSRKMGIETPIQICEKISEARDNFSHNFQILPLTCKADIVPGQVCPENAESIIASIETAVKLSLDKLVDGVVTNPIHKASLKAADFPHPGHTEFLAHLSANATPVMMLEGEGLKTIPLTRHIPLKEVSSQLKASDLIRTVQITHTALQKYFSIKKPRIVVSGLNPHAGEDGILGQEENTIIRPAIEQLKESGIAVRGPLPADTMFHKSAREKYDVAICMYHDQALIPVKMIGFDTGVNITLGLDFIRTSPDHGTAFDIAPKYIANPDSLISAITRAAHMSLQLDEIET